MPVDGIGTAPVCGTCDGTASPGRLETSSLGRKTVPGPSRGGAGGEGEETSGSENETRLVVAGPHGCEPGSLPRRRWLPGVASRGRASLKAANGNNLVPGPNLDGPQHRTA
jgi:hypothetical protein